ncbi:HNH endonuclease signature motif containing protein [Paenibacillus sp. VCA1]|uniref:HNH endonuclease signature motif containing protein n=1 Tax=Paenibacillus sp. VCA1 TaxID=3039148 RepID=UPI0028723F81|nr:HNH endonuclease signature motif containing protein [Paenibacillus sp. VCA1]MDR9855702.1 HNH endonuclease signature motif containing protein [Paenibacillus sp. VCA1]
MKRSSEELEGLRKEFDSKVRKEFLQNLAKNTDYLKKAGFTDTDILKIVNGKVPDGWQVHHKIPIDDGGTNAFYNLILIKNEPYHKVITNFQNSFAKSLKTGESKTVDWPVPDGNIYPKTH